MPERQVVSTEALCGWMTRELQQYEGCAECAITAVHRLRDIDIEGCNWSLSSLRATGIPQELYGPPLDEVARKARAKFNLK